MGYRRYRRRKIDGDLAAEGLIWLIDWNWRIGAALSLIGFVAFWYTLIGALKKFAEPITNPIADFIPLALPALLFVWPVIWFVVFAWFGWAALNSWIKSQEQSNHWF